MTENEYRAQRAELDYKDAQSWTRQSQAALTAVIRRCEADIQSIRAKHADEIGKLREEFERAKTNELRQKSLLGQAREEAEKGFAQ